MWQPLRRLLGIHSPSRLYAGEGARVAGLWAKGLADPRPLTAAEMERLDDYAERSSRWLRTGEAPDWDQFRERWK